VSIALLSTAALDNANDHDNDNNGENGGGDAAANAAAAAAVIERRLTNVATLGIYRVQAFFHHWLVVARIKTKHGLHLRTERHRQRDK
jgi:hypothetical protein